MSDSLQRSIVDPGVLEVGPFTADGQNTLDDLVHAAEDEFGTLTERNRICIWPSHKPHYLRVYPKPSS